MRLEILQKAQISLDMLFQVILEMFFFICFAWSEQD